MKKRIVVSFSGGKDSTLALYRLIRSGEWEIDSLLTTISEEDFRTNAHGVREKLLEQQALSLGLPLRKVYLPENRTNEIYQQRMGDAFQQIVKDGITDIMFGDIHLQDIKDYREKMVRNHSLNAIFPVWGEDSKRLIAEFLNSGFKTVVTCVNGNRLDSSFTGRVIDEKFLQDLPHGVDHCGENGEFHTFVFDGPLFSKPVNFKLSNEITEKTDPHTNQNCFYFIDLVPY
ncbi:diphthine--ammonia ligase [Neobacillus cucumis]|uniref:Dph6-related ATP pyrophosphatase n=1 Tax=Neobacillus cucumis TaxID=1740721 RepID=UPI0018DF5925|nr:diphthine--ammonia ligase [Neobacillus cucumis]MBI0577079.1 diphthine--ammonia ligase [Neobacillus cucumis]